ncbi:uncharacterized protein C17orf98-like [Chanos chanos]|uniref:Uncharacterized protein C17orf98-like n=1 Tax=Chanos chanos TaxID=29144 RepID=A0A6J2VPP2_CHACN|nr:uncharacterized protein C17orf98 homolog [Chanos chanos]
MNRSSDEKREKGFVLDCVAVSSVAKGYEHTRPQLWSVLPPYHARNDPHATRYISIPAVQRTLKNTEPADQCSSSAKKLLDLRNSIGAGRSKEQVSNHSGLLMDIKPLIGYNGRFGFRRNTPKLRQNSSSFGEVTSSPLY